MMTSNKDQALVSVGMPTYNRPDIMVKALDSLLNQTYKNIEIIISDNASPDEKVKSIAETYCSQDKRIKYIRNSENIGPSANFWSVLNLSSGKFFMWAADDDSWEKDYIETGLKNIGNSGTAMGDMETVFHLSGSVVPSFMPRLGSEYSTYENACAFLKNMQPSIFYGIHQTSMIRECIPEREFDFLDCFIVYRMLLRYGIKTYPGIYYRAGVYSTNYEIKFADESKKRINYYPFIYEIIKETFKSRKLSTLDKLRLCKLAIKIVFDLYRHLSRVLNQDKKLT